MADSDASQFSSDSDDSYIPSDFEEDNESPYSEDEIGEDSPEEEEHVTLSSSGEWGDCTNTRRRFNFPGGTTLGVQLGLSGPVSVYQNLLNDDVPTLIVEETNRFASQFIDSEVISPRSRMRKWKDTDKGEIRKFIAILIAMGINHLPKMLLYWSQKSFYGNDLIRNIMSRDRFELILKCFHVSKNADLMAKSDRLAKVRPLLALLGGIFNSTLTPG